MRHLKTGRKFGRTSAHRKALFRNMVTALIGRERIRTTLAKAKELRGKVEKTITLGKKGTLHARRHALKLVADKDSLKKIFGPLAERYANRPGGYTRVIKLGHRLGDDAPMAFIELVDREGGSPVKQPDKGKKKVGVTAKKAAVEEKEKNPKKGAKESIVKTTGKKSDGEKKKVAQTKKKMVDKKEKSVKKDKKTDEDSTTKKS
jgi:large subunit ribosomal protein L17